MFERSKLEAEPQDVWLDYARQSGLSAEMVPRPNTVARERLENLCREFIDIVLASIGSGKEGVLVSNEKRRIVHDQLCRLLTGKGHHELSDEMTEQISDFAAEVAGHPEFVGQF